MKLFRKKLIVPAPTDPIPEKIHKRLKTIYFFLWCILGVCIFMLFYGTLVPLLLDVPEPASEESPFLCHEYCGTFFVEINRDNSFASPEAYTAYCEQYNAEPEKAPLAEALITTIIGSAILIALLVLHLTKKLPAFLNNRWAKALIAGVGLFILTGQAGVAVTVLMSVCLFLALRCGAKKTVFCKHASDFFLIGGLLWLGGDLATEVRVILHTKERGEGMIGVFSQPVYYCQLYRFTLITVLILCCGLMLRQHELHLANADTKRNSFLLKGIAYAILGGTAGFTLWRMGVRTYELIRVMSGDRYSVWLPFTVMDHPYNRLIELPYDMAKTPQDYRNTILFRYVKDFPTAVLCVIAAVLFVRVLLAIARGGLNTPQNRKRLNITMLLLLGASLWFNLMGFKELDFFNNGFTGIYGEVTYTPGLRAMTEPALYAVILWFFKTYLQTIPSVGQGAPAVEPRD